MSQSLIVLNVLVVGDKQTSKSLEIFYALFSGFLSFVSFFVFSVYFREQEGDYFTDTLIDLGLMEEGQKEEFNR